ncbi:hypothetical protein DSL72_006722 [Monilinia vaccinii-corymbosi]|uniref:Uncharacterized protein n=1 Tax=Monilinia vaccinii-corymbosi TaxID=61207 RepID=A0A8A3PPK1_9HELO|nr:hypothetical protein DSL72_006722 [Monilinia vaccinii-corymbosi]
MNSSTSVMQLLAVIALLFTNAFANPIKRNDAQGTPFTVPRIDAMFTTIAKLDLTTVELVSVVVISSRTVYVKQPNNFPATVWGVSEATQKSHQQEILSSTTRSILATGQVTAACVACRNTIGMKEPNHDPNKTWHGISTTKAPTSQTCNTAVASVTIPVADLTIGEYVAAHVTCGKTIYIQEPNFYGPKTHYGIPASGTATSSAAASHTRVAVEPRMLKVSARTKPSVDRSRPTSLHQADEGRFRGVPSAVAGKRAAAMALSLANWEKAELECLSNRPHIKCTFE